MPYEREQAICPRRINLSEHVIGRMNDAIKAVEANGGKVLMQPMHMGEYGIRSLILDCEGNRVALYDNDKPNEHTICWAELSVTNLPRAIKFYSTVLGKEVLHIQTDKFEFGMFQHENDNVSGCLTTESTPWAEGALVYLNVINRMYEALKAVEQNGGKIALLATKLVRMELVQSHHRLRK